MAEWKKIVKNSKRYKGFVIEDDPKPFNALFAGKDVPCVQIHSVELCGDDDIVGFCGAFRWYGGSTPATAEPLDGDTYYPNMLVLGYNWFWDKNGNRCLDILVGDDW